MSRAALARKLRRGPVVTTNHATSMSRQALRLFSEEPRPGQNPVGERALRGAIPLIPSTRISKPAPGSARATPSPEGVTFSGGTNASPHKDDAWLLFEIGEFVQAAPSPHPEVRAKRASKGICSVNGALRKVISRWKRLARQVFRGSRLCREHLSMREAHPLHLSPCGRGRHAAGVAGEGAVRQARCQTACGLTDPSPVLAAHGRPLPQGER